MNIIFFVDFKSKNINNDFKISNAMLDEHTILLVTSIEQLQNSIKAYDLVIIGSSCENIDLDINKKIIKFQKDWDLDRLRQEINKWKSTNLIWLVLF